MSLVLGIRLPATGQVLVMADTRTRSSDFVVAPYDKVRQWWSYVVGHAGRSADYYKFFYGLRADTDLMDPKVIMERSSFAAAIAHGEIDKGHLSSGDAEFSLVLLIARGPVLLEVNSLGHASEVETFVVMGALGWYVGQYLLGKSYRPDLTVEEAVALGQHVIREVATVDTSVGPEALWLVTPGLGGA